MHDLVIFRIKAKWNKFEERSGILCRKMQPQRMKDIVYKVRLRSVMEKKSGRLEPTGWKQLK